MKVEGQELEHVVVGPFVPRSGVRAPKSVNHAFLIDQWSYLIL